MVNTRSFSGSKLPFDVHVIMIYKFTIECLIFLICKNCDLRQLFLANTMRGEIFYSLPGTGENMQIESPLARGKYSLPYSGGCCGQTDLATLRMTENSASECANFISLRMTEIKKLWSLTMAESIEPLNGRNSRAKAVGRSSCLWLW